jgi:hypothetical protein
MNIELSRKDLSLLNMMLNKEVGDTRVEIRHSDNMDYKNCLKDREQQLDALLQRVSVALKDAPRDNPVGSGTG